MKQVLVHACCGPCLIYPFEQLKRNGFLPSAYWYNPNIFPEKEYQKRKESLLSYCHNHEITVCESENESRQEYYKWLFSGLLNAKNRCYICWEQRLLKTAIAAKQLKFSAFTTTLLVSTYQDIDAIMRIGKAIADRENIEFLAIDFRAGFDYAHCKAEEEGLYKQRWCGCIYSFNDRFNAMSKRHRPKARK